MFLVCGESLFDLFIDAHADDDGPLILRGVPGGSPHNVAIGLARLGSDVAFATQIFTDALGRRLEEALRHEGVDLSFARRATGATPLAIAQMDNTGVPQYAFHGVRDMCVHPQFEGEIDARVTAFHVGSIPIISASSSVPLLELVSSTQSRLVSFDPNVRLTVEPDPVLWRQQVDQFRRHAHLVKVSVEDMQAIYGSSCDAEDIAADWAQGSTTAVALTRGRSGCGLFLQGGETIDVPAVSVDVVDTVGAGDTFMAALLCWLNENGRASRDGLRSLDRHQVRAMAEFANQAAAYTCSRRGADMPRRTDLVEL